MIARLYSVFNKSEIVNPNSFYTIRLHAQVGCFFFYFKFLQSMSGVCLSTYLHLAKSTFSENIPFRPFCGRRNKETMYYDHREWPYPVGQRPAQLLILALILEVKSKKMWTFEKFLNQFTSILCQANDNGLSVIIKNILHPK